MAQEMDVTAKFRADITDMNAKMKTLDTKLKGIESQATKTSKTMSEKFDKAGKSMMAVGKKMSLGITAPLVGIGLAAGKAAMDFEKSMGKIVALVGLSREEVNEMKGAVLELSGETAKAPEELADALFVVTSAGLKGEAAIDALTASAKASAAGLGETADIARAVAGSVNAYGKANLSAAKATDVIVATARAGNFETSQFAGAIGRVLPMAKQAGASLEEMGGAVALLTRTNGDAAMSVTQIQALFKAFVVPTQEAVTELDKMGMTASDLRDKISQDGLVSAMNDLDESLGGNRELLGRLVGGAEAASAAFQILDADAESISGTFGTVADSVNMTSEAFDVASQSSSFKMTQALTKLKVVLIDIGASLLPIISGIAQKISLLAGAFSTLPGPMKKVILVFGGIAAAIGPVLLISGKLMTMFVANSARISAAAIMMSKHFTAAMTAMRGASAKFVLQLKANMIMAKTQIGALGMVVKTVGATVVAGFRTMAVAAKGLLLSFGPIGVALVLLSAAYDIMSNGADRGAGSVNNLTEALKQQGDAGKKAAADMLAEDLYEANRFQLEALGISYEEAIAAIVGGKEAVAEFNAEVQAGPKGGGAVARGLTESIKTLAENFDTATSRVSKQSEVQEEAYKAMGLTEEGSDSAAASLRNLGGDVEDVTDEMAAAGEEALALGQDVTALSAIFTGMNKNISAIRAQDEFTKLLKGMDEAIAKNNKSLSGNSDAAMQNRAAVLDAFNKGQQDAEAWGKANDATIKQVRVRFEENTKKIKQTLIDQKFSVDDLEVFLGAEGIDAAATTVQAELDRNIRDTANKLQASGFKQFKGVGFRLVEGLIVGMDSQGKAINQASFDILQTSSEAARQAAGIQSPSTVWAELGKNLTEGLIVGIKDGGSDVGKIVKESFGSWFTEAKENLKSQLNEAKQDFQDFRGSVLSTFKSIQNFGQAQSGGAGRLNAIAEATENLKNEQAKYNVAQEKAIADGLAVPDRTPLTNAEEDLANATAAGEQLGTTFMSSLQAQSEKAMLFGQRIKTLIAEGLSLEALEEVIKVGADGGIEIADEMIAGGKTTIDNANDLVASMNTQAEDIATHTSEAFKRTGIKEAKKTLEGFKSEFGKGGRGRAKMGRIMTNLARSMDRESRVTVTTFHKSIFLDGQKALGGPVSAAKTYLVGEKGPEIFVPNIAGNIIPNNEFPMPAPLSFGAGTGGISTGGSSNVGGNVSNMNSYAITVNTGVGDPRRIGEEIINNLTKFEQANGAVFVRK